MSRSLRVMVLMHEDLMPPESLTGYSELEILDWKTEFDVVAGLETLGHDVMQVGVASDLSVLDNALDDFRPHITFNLLEEFHGVAVYDYYVVSFMELKRRRYTGCNPRGLMLAHDKALSKQILTYHRVAVPKCAEFTIGKKVKRPSRLQFPLIVKSLVEDGSVGIAQASVVYNDEKLVERVHFIHEQIGTDAIAEQYIDGRELYVGVIGNQRLQTLPIWELLMPKLPNDAPRIATIKIKWDPKYQKQIGVKTAEAQDLRGPAGEHIRNLCKRAYSILGLTGYARMDLRLTDDGRAYLIEANPNPQLSYGEDFAESAHHVGLEYEALLERIINLGMRYRPLWKQ